MKYKIGKKIVVLAILLFFAGASLIQNINADILQKTEENILIDDNQPPIADFHFEQDPTNQYVFHFYSEGYSYDPDGQIIYWRWNFNDGTPNSVVLNISNPTYDFTHIAGHDLTISLIVGDDGIPKLFNSTYKIISIPDQNGKSNPVPENIYSSNNYLKPTSVSDKTLEEQSLSAGDCDIYIYNVSYAPSDLRVNRYVYISFNVGDNLDNYFGTFYIELFIEEFNLGLFYNNLEYGNDTTIVYFKWPDAVTGTFNIIITLYPQQYAGWNDIDWDNNNIKFSITVNEPKNTQMKKGYANIVNTPLKFLGVFSKLTEKPWFQQNEQMQLILHDNTYNPSSSKSDVSPLNQGDCNFYWGAAVLYPYPPKLNKYLTSYAFIVDHLNNYDFSKVIIEIECEDLGIHTIFDINYGDHRQEHEIFFQWPLDGLSEYYLKLTIYPFSEAGWNEINWEDNSITLDLEIYQYSRIIVGLISNVEEYNGVTKFDPIFVIMLPSEQKIYTSGTIFLKNYDWYLGQYLIFTPGSAAVLS